MEDLLNEAIGMQPHRISIYTHTHKLLVVSCRFRVCMHLMLFLIFSSLFVVIVAVIDFVFIVACLCIIIIIIALIGQPACLPFELAGVCAFLVFVNFKSKRNENVSV